MKIPEGMCEAEKKLARFTKIVADERSDESSPIRREKTERAKAALRMIERARPAEFPERQGQNESSHLVVPSPPSVPEFANIGAGVRTVGGEIRGRKKTGDAEEK